MITLRPRWEKQGHDYLLTSTDAQHLAKVSSAGKMRYNIEIDGMRTSGRVHGLIQACEEAEKRLAQASEVFDQVKWAEPKIDSGPVKELVDLLDDWWRDGVITYAIGSPAARIIRRVRELL